MIFERISITILKQSEKWCFQSQSNLVECLSFGGRGWNVFLLFWVIFLTKGYGTHSLTIGNKFLEFRKSPSVTKASHKQWDNCSSIHNWMVEEFEVFYLLPKHSLFKISYLVQKPWARTWNLLKFFLCDVSHGQDSYTFIVSSQHRQRSILRGLIISTSRSRTELKTSVLSGMYMRITEQSLKYPLGHLLLSWPNAPP